MTKDDQKEALKICVQEAHLGECAQNAFDTYIKDFVEKQTIELFEGFKRVSIDDIETMKNLKLSQMALDTLIHKVNIDINNGKAAKILIEQYSKE